MILYNLLWKYFVETTFHIKLAIEYSQNNGVNTLLAGYPGADKILYKQRIINNIWKQKNSKIKRIISATHYSIEESGNSNFLDYYDTMKKLSEHFINIQLAFKPHPLLKQKQYNHPD